MDTEENDSFLTSFSLEEESPAVDWKERLRIATTVAEFEAVKSDIVPDNISSPYLFIKHPVVLRCYLTTFPCEEKCLCSTFRKCAYDFRVDMLDVVLDFITLECIRRRKPMSFDNVIDNIIGGGYVDVMACLLRRGLNPNLIMCDESLLTAACRIRKVDIVDLLLEHDANVNTGEPFPPVFAAITSGDINILDRLIVRGADLSVRGTCYDLVSGMYNMTLWKYLCIQYNFPGVVFYQRLADMRLPILNKGLIKLFEENVKGATPEERETVVSILRDAGAE